ncbi:glycosyl hydrolase [Pelomyxa schiedti]|nr:glycosyl hydrolase [Pelomyxa schiedti]
MTADEKWPQLIHAAPAIERLGVINYTYWMSCQHGVLFETPFQTCGDHGCPTSFPEGPAYGASFNMSLVKEVATAISDEFRALWNAKDPLVVGLDCWDPNINLMRDPRWGRNMEIPSEDPFLSGEYSVSFIQGLQEGNDPRYTKIAGTCKHFAAYSVDNYNGVDRDHYNAIVSDYDLYDSYFPAFQKCVEEGKSRSIMCSYNELNGVPTCASDFLLNDVLRNQWHFDGYVVSDCDSVADVYATHHYCDNATDATAVCLLAGCDLDCGTAYNAIPDALESDYISQSDIDLALSRVFRERFLLGLFDPPELQPYAQLQWQDLVQSPSHKSLARLAAKQSLVLLKNEENVLPLNKYQSVAVIGPHANATVDMLGNYHGPVCPGTFVYDCITSPLHAIGELIGADKVTYAQGCDVACEDTSGFENAISVAKAADAIVLFLGLNISQEDETHDRLTITLPGNQELLAQVLFQTNVPVAVVLFNGGALAISWIHDNIPAIIEAFYPGQEGASAFVDESDFLSMDMTASPGRTYRFYTGTPLWEFGFGLSYTTFTVTWPDDTLGTKQTLSSEVHFEVLVTNTGPVAGDYIALAFASPPKEDTTPLLKQLFGFQRVYLEPGQSQLITFFAEYNRPALVCHPPCQVLLSCAGLQMEWTIPK